MWAAIGKSVEATLLLPLSSQGETSLHRVTMLPSSHLCKPISWCCSSWDINGLDQNLCNLANKPGPDFRARSLDGAAHRRGIVEFQTHRQGYTERLGCRRRNSRRL